MSLKTVNLSHLRPTFDGLTDSSPIIARRAFSVPRINFRVLHGGVAMSASGEKPCLNTTFSNGVSFWALKNTISQILLVTSILLSCPTNMRNEFGRRQLGRFSR